MFTIKSLGQQEEQNLPRTFLTSLYRAWKKKFFKNLTSNRTSGCTH